MDDGSQGTNSTPALSKTVTVHVAATSPHEAVITAEPAERAVIRPLSETVATELKPIVDIKFYF